MELNRHNQEWIHWIERLAPIKEKIIRSHSGGWMETIVPEQTNNNKTKQCCYISHAKANIMLQGRVSMGYLLLEQLKPRKD